MKLNLKEIEQVSDGKTYQDTVDKSLYLRNRKTKTWWIVKKISGKTKWIRIGTYPEMGISAARKAASIEKANLLTQKKQHVSVLTLNDVMKQFAIEKEGVNKSLTQMQNLLNRPDIQILAQKEIAQITPDDIRELKRRMKSTPVLFNRIRAVISTLFNFAARNMELNVNNPVLSVAKNREKVKHTHLPIEKSSLFFDELNSGRYPEIFADVIKTLIYTGQRKSNVFEMEWSEINFSERVWIIPPEKSKNKKEMITPIEPDAFYHLLQRRFNQHESKKYVFPQAGSRKKHIIDIKKTFRRFCLAIGEPNLTIHDLRRTHGTWMLNSGASIEEVSASLHHSDIRITQKVYAEMLTGTVRAGVRKMWDKIKPEE